MGECWPFVIQGRIDVKLFYFYSRDELHFHSRKKKEALYKVLALPASCPDAHS